MKHVYDFSLDVTLPLAVLERFDTVINNHAHRVWDSDSVQQPTADDEAEMMATLFGLGRLVEVNVRIAWETFAIKEGLDEQASPGKYKRVLALVETHIKNDPIHWLFRNALSIADGLVHGNFYQAYRQASKAYDRKDLGLTQDRFVHQTITLATLTSDGLQVDATTGVATASSGKPLAHRSYVPAKSKTIADNFEAFYVSAGFVPVCDVLKTSLQHAYLYRHCIAVAPKVTQDR